MEPSDTLPDTEQTTPQTPKSTSTTPNHTPDNPNHPHNPYNTNTNYHSRQRLNSWLQTARKTKTPINNSPSPKQPTKSTAIQTTLNPDTENDHWGDELQPEPSSDVLRIISKNVNSLNTDDDFIDWKATIDAMV